MNTLKVLGQLLLIAVAILGSMYAWNNYKVSEEQRPISNFNSIYTGGIMNVYLIEGEVPALQIRADDNIMAQVKTEVINGQLHIYTEGHIQGERIKEAYVTYVALDSAYADGASTLTSRDKIDADNFKMTAAGAAELRIQIQCTKLELQMKDNANVQLAGATDYFQATIDHVGDLMAYNLEAKACTISLNTGPQSPGIARINVSDQLKASIIGPRHIYYRGDPDIIAEHIEGEGKLLKK